MRCRRARTKFEPMKLSDLIAAAQKEFDKKFVRDDALMDKYQYDDEGPISTADSVKIFISNSITTAVEETLEEAKSIVLQEASTFPDGGEGPSHELACRIEKKMNAALRAVGEKKKELLQ
jgi:hypothetical protein